jgi:hypothetical protein
MSHTYEAGGGEPMPPATRISCQPCSTLASKMGLSRPGGV